MVWELLVTEIKSATVEFCVLAWIDLVEVGQKCWLNISLLKTSELRKR